MKILGVSGSLSNPSRTTVLVELILRRIADHLPVKLELINIADLGPELCTTLDPKSRAQAVEIAYRKLYDAHAIIIGTPVYKASYTGLLKHFFDLADPKALSGRVAALAATGGSDHHALVLEHHLRPLASFLGMHTVPTAIYTKDADFIKSDTGYQLAHAETLRRIDMMVEQIVERLEVESRRADAVQAMVA